MKSRLLVNKLSLFVLCISTIIASVLAIAGYNLYSERSVDQAGVMIAIYSIIPALVFYTYFRTKKVEIEGDSIVYRKRKIKVSNVDWNKSIRSDGISQWLFGGKLYSAVEGGKDFEYPYCLFGLGANKKIKALVQEG